MAAGDVARRRWLPWLAVGIGLLMLAPLCVYVVNPFATASLDPRARLFGYVTYRAGSISMAPTIERGQIVLVDSKAFASRGPARNDIVVYLSARDGSPWLFRVAALSGERVEIREGQLIIDGQAQPPPSGLDVPTGPGPGRDMAPRVIPEDHFFLLGDNRDFAEDSRYGGPVAREKLVGRVVRILR